MDGNMFEPLDKLFRLLFWTAVIATPFAIWKLVDLAIWMFSHLRWEGA